MKVNPGQTRGLDRILNHELGTGTAILTEGSAIKLIPGENDQIQLSQLGNRLQILVNGSDKFLLTERESQNFEIQGDQKNITIDPSVSLYSNPKNVAIPAESKIPFPEISTARSEQLGQARRAESTFGTAITRGMITDGLKEDAFINHIGKQMQRLLGEVGISTPQPTSFRTEKDILPFLKQLESISNPGTGKTPFSQNFQSDLNKTVQKVEQQINNGEPVDLDFLGSKITAGLKQIIDKKSHPVELQPGKIPFEEHAIPVGESQQEAFKKWEMINEGITKNDAGMIAELAGDFSTLKIALPVERAAFLSVLAKAEKPQNMIQILQSSQNIQEFRSVVDLAGIEKIQEAFKHNPAEFNFTAHVFRSPELALNLEQTSFSGNQYMQGFSPQQIFAQRGSLEDAGNFSENPILLAFASPEEKASLIQKLKTGYVPLSENRSIINILQSAMNKSEFDQIVDSSGGKAIASTLQDPISLMQWNRLAGAFDRMDLTTDFVEGVKYSGALLEPFPFDVNEQVSLLPLAAPSILSEQPVEDIAGMLKTFMKEANYWIGNQISVLDRGAYVQAGLENLNHMMEERPLFNIPLIRNQLHSALQGLEIHSPNILNSLQEFASTAGLTDYDLRNLISQPLAFVYGTAATEAEMLAKNASTLLQQNFQLSVFQYGAKSDQAKFVEGLIGQVQKTFVPFADHLRSVSNVLSELFLPPADFITSLSKFASGFNKNVAPILSSVFPSFSEVANHSFENGKTIDRLIEGKYQISEPANPVTSSTPEVSQIRADLTNLMDGIEVIRNGSVARELSRVEQELLRVPDMPRDLIQFTKQAKAFISSVQDGSYANTLKDVASALKDDDPIAELTKTTAQNGAAFLMQLHNGSFTKAHKDFLNELDNFQNSPGVSKMKEFFGKLSSLTNGIVGGLEPSKISDDAVNLISAAPELRGSFTNIVNAAKIFRNSPAFRKMMELLDGGSKFLTALTQGNFAQSMELMNSRFGYSPAVAQVIERGLHLTTAGSNVLKNLVPRDLERPIAQLTRKAQAKTQAAKEIIDAENVFAMTATPFFALTEVENMNRLWQYHRQLDLVNDKMLADPTIRTFEKQIGLLAKEPELKKNLQKQFNSFQNLRSKNS